MAPTFYTAFFFKVYSHTPEGLKYSRKPLLHGVSYYHTLYLAPMVIVLCLPQQVYVSVVLFLVGGWGWGA